ncbi:MAG: adenosylhomocysteinase, partial [Clostridia bacterium]|nr:adenosylhomocysteinase [Clostridia bacterium]
MKGGSRVRDPGLAPAGEAKIAWARRHMPVLRAVAERLGEDGELRGRRIAACLHIEAKTACLALALRDAGADVALVPSNPLSTQDDVAAALAAAGVAVHAWRGASPDEYEAFLEAACDFRPDIVVDDGADLIVHLHTRRRDRLGDVIGASEETTTGLVRLRAMEADGSLRFPVVAVNDARMKYLFDNRYGTGQSVWDAILRTTNLLVAGRVVVVLGYGWCGRGVALRARGLGARVVVCEVDPVAANEAILDGCAVMPAVEAAAVGDVFVTATGCSGVLRREHFLRMKDGALLANAGHFDVEVDVRDLASLAVDRRPVRPGVEAFRLPAGRDAVLQGEGQSDIHNNH